MKKINPTSIGITGASGRMGSRIIALASQSKQTAIGALFDQAGSPALGTQIRGVEVEEIGVKKLGSLNALIDFTAPSATLRHAELCRQSGCALVIGTTGFKAADKKRIQNIARSIPVVVAPNMSVGANLLFDLVKKASQILGLAYDAEIIEAHHRLKKDAPSGTALRFAEAVSEGRKALIKSRFVFGREGITGQRRQEEIGIHAVRAGEIVGLHRILFSGPGETVEFVHEAHSRDAFARGALLAAQFASRRSKGLFDMRDVLWEKISRKNPS